jgi:selenocysteine-specific elongation factor
VRLLDHDALEPGDEGWAQLKLDRPVAVAKGDYFVVRDPNETTGGGQVVDAHPRRHRRFQAGTLKALEALDRGSPEEELLAALGGREPSELGTLVRQTSLSAEEAKAAGERLVEEGRVVALSPPSLDPQAPLFTSEGFSALGGRARDAVGSFHREYPLRKGIRREELRSRLALPPRVFALALERWLERGELREWGAVVGLPGYQPALSPAQEAEASSYLQRLEDSPFAPPTDRPPDPEILSYLEDEGQVVQVGGAVVFAASAYREMTERIIAHLRERSTITLAEVRDLFSNSRRYAQSLLEHLDRRGITRRLGDERVLRRRPG